MFKLVLEKAEENKKIKIKAEEPEIKLPTSFGSRKKQEFSRKTSISALLTMPNHNKLWKILKEMGIPEHLTCLLRNLCAGQKASYNWTWNNTLVPNQERSTSRLYIVTRLFNLYAEYIMRNAALNEAQGGIRIVGRNINNLRYADDTTLMAEINEKLKKTHISYVSHFVRKVPRAPPRKPIGALW